MAFVMKVDNFDTRLQQAQESYEQAKAVFHERHEESVLQAKLEEACGNIKQVIKEAAEQRSLVEKLTLNGKATQDQLDDFNIAQRQFNSGMLQHIRDSREGLKKLEEESQKKAREAEEMQRVLEEKEREVQTIQSKLHDLDSEKESSELRINKIKAHIAEQEAKVATEAERAKKVEVEKAAKEKAAAKSKADKAQANKAAAEALLLKAEEMEKVAKKKMKDADKEKAKLAKDDIDRRKSINMLRRTAAASTPTAKKILRKEADAIEDDELPAIETQKQLNDDALTEATAEKGEAKVEKKAAEKKMKKAKEAVEAAEVEAAEAADN